MTPSSSKAGRGSTGKLCYLLSCLVIARILIRDTRGCVTPRQIASIQEIVDENGDRDMTLLDGYDEIPADSQKKIADAVEQGHVDDEDWKGVCSSFAV